MINKASITVGWLISFAAFVVLALAGIDLWKYVFSATVVLGAIAGSVRSQK